MLLEENNYIRKGDFIMSENKRVPENRKINGTPETKVKGNNTKTVDSVVNEKKVETPRSYKVKVNVPALNIRTAPNIKSDIAGCIRDSGIYTIERKTGGSGANNGWGKLQSGAGWINLDFVTEV